MKLRIVFKEHVMLTDLQEIYKTAAQELNHLDEPNKIKWNVHFWHKGKTRQHQEKTHWVELSTQNTETAYDEYMYIEIFITVGWDSRCFGHLNYDLT